MSARYSVLMSVYDKVSPQELNLSIESMLGQTVKPGQFVIVFDGPVGEDLNGLVDSYCLSEPELFTIVQLPENRGLAYALNAGLRYCRYDLVARMDSDDFSLPHRCEKQLSEFDKKPNLALIGTFIRTFKTNINDASPGVTAYPLNNVEIRKAFRRTCPFAHPTVMYKKEAVYRCGGYDPALKRSQDHDLFSKMVGSGCEAENIGEPLLLYRTDDKCMKRNKSRYCCKVRILIQHRILKRKECSYRDYLFIAGIMTVLPLLPLSWYTKLYTLVKGTES